MYVGWVVLRFTYFGQVGVEETSEVLSSSKSFIKKIWNTCLKTSSLTHKPVLMAAIPVIPVQLGSQSRCHALGWEGQSTFQTVLG